MRESCQRQLVSLPEVTPKPQTYFWVFESHQVHEKEVGWDLAGSRYKSDNILGLLCLLVHNNNLLNSQNGPLFSFYLPSTLATSCRVAAPITGWFYPMWHLYPHNNFQKSFYHHQNVIYILNSMLIKLPEADNNALTNTRVELGIMMLIILCHITLTSSLIMCLFYIWNYYHGSPLRRQYY